MSRSSPSFLRDPPTTMTRPTGDDLAPATTAHSSPLGSPTLSRCCRQLLTEDLARSSRVGSKGPQPGYEVYSHLRKWIHYLEAQLQCTQTAHSTLPTRVGDLQNMSTTRAFILFPHIGRMAVYDLAPMDVQLLDLINRSELLSSPFCSSKHTNRIRFCHLVIRYPPIYVQQHKYG